MRTHAKHFVSLLALGTIVALLIAGCNMFGSGTGTMKLSLTDAPIDDTSVTGVHIKINAIEYNPNDEGWVEMTGYDGGTYNLLELVGGKSELLGELDLEAGTYEQIRFMLDVPDQTQQGALSNPGSYIAFDDDGDGTVDRKEALFAPSGGQTGYKATAAEAFSVPANGTVDITADFDVRRAVVEAGALYVLKPVLRLVVTGEAGSIAGSVSNATAEQYTVLAYEDGTYDADEPTADSGGTRFGNAISSFSLTEAGDYTLAFLAEGTYDLHVARYVDSNGDGELEYDAVAAGPQDVSVDAGQDVTGQDINVGALTYN